MNNFDETKHPRASDGKFTDGSGGDGGNDGYFDGVNERIKWAKENGKEVPLNADGSLDDLKLQEMYEAEHTEKKMTPAEKIASVHIDFTKDNILPELNEEDLPKIGAKKNKPVLLKKNIIDRNSARHPDISDEDLNGIVANALYSPSEIFHGYSEKPYYNFAKLIEINSKGKPEIGLVLLDIDEKKDNFEVVHAHFVNDKGLQRVKSRKKD